MLSETRRVGLVRVRADQEREREDHT